MISSFSELLWINALVTCHESQRLSTMSTEISECEQLYSYSKVPLASNSVRLLDVYPGTDDDEIEGEFRETTLGCGEVYETLSYVWGQDARGHHIKISGKRIRVTDNLHAALRRLRRSSKRRTLWVDALCINQHNDMEKTGQVNKMHDIYQQCSRCLIWLGELPEDISHADATGAFDFIKLIGEAETETRSLDGDGQAIGLPASLSSGDAQARAAKALDRMMVRGNPYWGRIWTVQEAILPNDALVIWGTLSIPWSVINNAADNLLYSEAAGKILSKTPHFVWDILNEFTCPVRGLGLTTSGDSILDVVRRWRCREATDPRDKVYALVGILEDLFGSNPLPRVPSCDYTLSLNTLYKRTTLDLLAVEGSLIPFVGWRGERHETKGLPSWTIDWIRPQHVPCRSYWENRHRYGYFNADGNTDLSMETYNDDNILSLKGLFIDKVVMIGDVLTREHENDEDMIRALEQWEGALAGFISSKFEKDYAGSTWKKSFWRTVLSGSTSDGRLGDSDKASFDQFRESRTWSDMVPSLFDSVLDQAFFITTQGYIGMGPPTTKAGDEVWVLFGGRVPFVLRPIETNGAATHGRVREKHCSLVGDAYVNGIMDGEALANDKGKPQVALLH
ncbi:heterokaryon incompatibility protein-domain-containing protein [Lineolata rhizophorae]|uniref:Heterokaryon incompatibility protein-domain-containing protein n=1 Tax=Lineolata rhizophorae TaxID=578093 RepID=A0A6A6NRU5_9PEZI|nr:heterokaryon incompatibility protein-domain-containing protein [Lineolata rhizophorae]